MLRYEASAAARGMVFFYFGKDSSSWAAGNECYSLRQVNLSTVAQANSQCYVMKPARPLGEWCSSTSERTRRPGRRVMSATRYGKSIFLQLRKLTPNVTL